MTSLSNSSGSSSSTILGTARRRLVDDGNSDDRDLDAAIECAGEMQIAVDCVIQDPTSCGGCIDTQNFAERFVPDLENEFRKQLAFTPAAEPEFCYEVDARMCTYHDETLSCCCQEETQAFFQCAWNRVYLTKFGVLERCESSCAGTLSSGRVGAVLSNNNIIMGIVVGVVAILCGAFIYYRKRKRRNDTCPTTTKADPSFQHGTIPTTMKPQTHETATDVSSDKTPQVCTTKATYSLY